MTIEIDKYFRRRIEAIREALPSYYDAIGLTADDREHTPQTDQEIVEAAIIHYQAHLSDWARQPKQELPNETIH